MLVSNSAGRMIKINKTEDNNNTVEISTKKRAKTRHHRVVHDYHDHLHDDEQAILEGTRGGVLIPFPVRLHQILEQVERDGLDDVVRWQPHGRCFVVKNPEAFISQILPLYFHQTKIASFQRQLNLYGFQRLTQGPDRGGYYHEYFLRGRVGLSRLIRRRKIKGTLVRAKSSPKTEPDFYSMPPVGQPSDTTSATAKSSPKRDADYYKRNHDFYKMPPVEKSDMAKEDHAVEDQRLPPPSPLKRKQRAEQKNSPPAPTDVFFVSNNEGAAHLIPLGRYRTMGRARGNQMFLSEAERSRKTFLEALENEDRYVECSEIASALALKLRENGTIYESKREGEWLPVTGAYESRDLIFRALLTLFTDNSTTEAIAIAPKPMPPTSRLVNTAVGLPSPPPLATPANPALTTIAPKPMPPTWRPVNTAAALPSPPPPLAAPKNPALTTTPLVPPLDTAPQWPSSVPPKKRRIPKGHIVIGPSILPKAAQPSIPNGASLQPFPSPTPLETMHPPTSQLQPVPERILDMNKNDVLCGRCPEEGVLNTENSGNLLFHNVADIVVEAFAAASTPEKAKYAMKAVDVVHNQVPRGRFLVMSEPGILTEIPLGEARWRAYWTFERQCELAHQMTARKSSIPAVVPPMSVPELHHEQVKRPPRQEVSRKEKKSRVEEKQEEENTPLSKTEQEDMFRSVPTHLSLVPPKLNRDRHEHHPVALLLSKPQLDTKAPSSKTEAKSEPVDEEEKKRAKEERAKRRQEKLKLSRAILKGELSLQARDGNPFSDIEQRRALAIKELKKRQQRTKIRKRLAAWDPGDLVRTDDSEGDEYYD